MFKYLIFLLKRIILCSFILYSFNLFSINFNFVIPFNIFNLIILLFLGVPGLIALVLFRLLLI